MQFASGDLEAEEHTIFVKELTAEKHEVVQILKDGSVVMVPELVL